MLEAREACWGATGRMDRMEDIVNLPFIPARLISDFVANNEIPCEWKTLEGCHAYYDADMFAQALGLYQILQDADPELSGTVKVITQDSISPSLSDLRVPRAVGAAPLAMSYVFAGHDKVKNVYQDDYLIQRPSGGELMFGGGRQYATDGGVGCSDDSWTSRSAAKYLRNELNHALDLSPSSSEEVKTLREELSRALDPSSSSSKELKASFEWTGIMGFSRDGRPWVGAVPEELGGGKGLWICAGFTGHGMPNATGCAKAVVELMLGKEGEEVDLPSVHRVGRERVERARVGDEVREADLKGFFV
ncbi:hypothetical protein M7I_2159 [Glarea lozoyensis 74030]|uniref:FAD dependent oxidoreductase domain-containing protein n=1 Tax=Glarea lozoyensis (strain ATCC 74030 / MF5533) TaxID=1104152 RepID=H0EI14_GLAL7|nr:hypothetical protein M7I_2159 [Glarea lozoyensis 74030]